MATKDITDRQVVDAYRRAVLERCTQRPPSPYSWPEQLLMAETGQCEKVCFSAMKRADKRGLIAYGVTLRSGWPTEKGNELYPPRIPGARYVSDAVCPTCGSPGAYIRINVHKDLECECGKGHTWVAETKGADVTSR